MTLASMDGRNKPFANDLHNSPLLIINYKGGGLGGDAKPPLVRMFIFLLSGLFCCLGFSDVFFAVWAGDGGGVFFFCCPAQTAKTKTHPRPNSKNK